MKPDDEPAAGAESQPPGTADPGTGRARPSWGVAVGAAGLAALGMVLTAIGEQAGGPPFLHERVGPAVTLLGAGLWVFAKIRGRNRE